MTARRYIELREERDRLIDISHPSLWKDYEAWLRNLATELCEFAELTEFAGVMRERAKRRYPVPEAANPLNSQMEETCQQK